MAQFLGIIQPTRAFLLARTLHAHYGPGTCCYAEIKFTAAAHVRHPLDPFVLMEKMNSDAEFKEKTHYFSWLIESPANVGSHCIFEPVILENVNAESKECQLNDHGRSWDIRPDEFRPALVFHEVVKQWVIWIARGNAYTHESFEIVDQSRYFQRTQRRQFVTHHIIHPHIQPLLRFLLSKLIGEVLRRKYSRSFGRPSRTCPGRAQGLVRGRRGCLPPTRSNRVSRASRALSREVVSAVSG